MPEVKFWTQRDRFGNDINEGGDVFDVSFGMSEHVTGVELAENILLRLDTGKITGAAPKAVGLTFISLARMMALYQDRPLSMPLTNLRNLPEDLWRTVLAVVTTPPVSDFLAIRLSLPPQVPPLPERIAA